MKLLETSFELLSYSNNLSDATANLFSIDTTRIDPKLIIAHPSQDVAVIKLFDIKTDSPNKMEAVPGVTIRTSAKTGIVTVVRENIKSFADVLIGNDIMILGYPTSLGLQAMSQIDVRRPLLRKGIVAGENLQARSIILDCPVYFGNSGGPVLEADPLGMSHRFSIIGVVSQYVPYADGGKTFMIMANSGYSVATPMDFVMELIK